MLKIEETGIEEFSFGGSRSDIFYLLINKKISPEGINIDKLRLSDPRNFDAVLNEMGCLIMLSGEEIDELARRGEIDPNALHKSLYELAAEEGLLG